MFESGFLTLGRFRGIPVRVHWTTPLGALLFTGFSFAPVAWLAFFLLVLVHELGHAAMVRRYRHRVLSVEVTGFGGLCRWAGNATPYERGAIAWGGVLAQMALLVATLGYVMLAGAPRTFVGADLYEVFVGTNLRLALLNLLPMPPLDGAEAWPFLRPAWSRLKARFTALRSRRAVSSAAQKASKPSPSSRPSAPLDPRAAAELAEILRKVGVEAGNARRGEKTRSN